MKKLRWILAAGTTLAVTVVAAQPTRQAFAANQTLTIKKATPFVTNAVAIDYQRATPAAKDTVDYTRVLVPGNVLVSFNGKPASQSFVFITSGQVKPLLRAYAVGGGPLVLQINPQNPVSRVIDSVQLTFKATVVMGTNPFDTVLTQFNAIAASWGFTAGLNTQQYQRRAKSLDILAANNLYQVTGNTIAANTQTLSNNLYATADFDVFSNAVFTNVLSGGLFQLNASGNLTPQSLYAVQQVYNYVPALQQSMAVNVYATPGLYYKAKQSFYTTSQRLIRTDASNKNIRDTLINGARYVLMVAWKSPGFFAFVNQPSTPGGMPVYPSSSGFFQYPLFLATQYEMQQFVKKNNMATWTEQQCRTRFKELLGLTPNSTNNTFVEFWVQEGDFFRPAVDSSIQCNMLFTMPTDSYLTGLTSYAQGSFNNPNILKQYPFTGLGYTWDCHPDTDHFGVSEFVMRENRKAYIRDSVGTMLYVQRMQAQ